MQNLCPTCSSIQESNTFCSECGSFVETNELELLNDILSGDREEAKKRRIIEKKIGTKIGRNEAFIALGYLIVGFVGLILIFILLGGLVSLF